MAAGGILAILTGRHFSLYWTDVEGVRRGIEDDECLLVVFFQAEDGIRDVAVTGVQTCALPISGVEAGPRAPPSRYAIKSAISPPFRMGHATFSSTVVSVTWPAGFHMAVM